MFPACLSLSATNNFPFVRTHVTFSNITNFHKPSLTLFQHPGNLLWCKVLRVDLSSSEAKSELFHVETHNSKEQLPARQLQLLACAV